MANRFEVRDVRAGRAEDEQWVNDRSVDGNGMWKQNWNDWLWEAIEYGRRNP